MSNHDIELPPLTELPAYSSEVFDREVKVVSETMAEQLMQEYASAAIELYQRRIEELESQLEAIGAGGVSSQRITSQRGGEPVARVNDDGFIVETGLGLAPGTLLYTAPQPAEPTVKESLTAQTIFADMRKMITPLAQRKIQSLLDKGEYRVIENATVLVNENGHAAIVNHVGAFYWVDNRGLAREFENTDELAKRLNDPTR